MKSIPTADFRPRVVTCRISSYFAVGNQIYLRGQVSGLWKNEDKAVTEIEMISPEILSVTRQQDVISDLINRITNEKMQ